MKHDRITIAQRFAADYVQDWIEASDRASG
jgi:hypothetical protein